MKKFLEQQRKFYLDFISFSFLHFLYLVKQSGEKVKNYALIEGLNGFANKLIQIEHGS